MIREIKYVCTAPVDYFTCHALFSRITDGALSKLKLNAYSKQPEYRISFQDRLITVLVNDSDINVLKELPICLEFNHRGKVLKAILSSDVPYKVKKEFNLGDFVIATGVISYAKNLSKQENISADNSLSGKEMMKKHQSPITPFGEILKGEKQATLDYFEKKLGVDLRTQTGDRTFRFEMLTYKHFESNHHVYSKSNNNKLSLHNVFSFELQGFVIEPSVTNSLEYTSIGKKRSYGFGNVYLK